MTAEMTTPKIEAEQEDAPGLIHKLKNRVWEALSAMNQYCETVEQAKAEGERENTLKHGKDWINRCCG